MTAHHTGWPHGRSRDGGVDEVPLPAGAAAGRLWLCGKHAIGPDGDGLLRRVGATTVVCLTERHELADRYPEFVAWLGHERGARAVWHPIHDLHAPSADAIAPLVDDVVARLRAGEGVVVHCGAGIGRAGTLAVCVLVSLGLDLDGALAHVAAHRPMAGPEVGAQRDLVHAWAARLRSATMGVALTKDSIDLGIVIRDAEASLAFYRDVLGFEDTGTMPMPVGGGTMYRLRCGTSTIKLVHPGTPPPASAPPGGIPGAYGYRYWTISVSNLEEITDACAAAGHRVVVPVSEIRPGVSISIVEDPDGNWVEFLRTT